MAYKPLSYFLASRLTGSESRSMTRRIVIIASASVAISMVVMIMAIGIVKGFQKEIKQKVTGFDGHILIRNLDLNHSGELALFPKDVVLSAELGKFSFVKAVSPVCQKPGIIRTPTDAEGVQCKGVAPGYGKLFINKYIVRGRSLQNTDSTDVNEVLISETTSRRLNLDTGDRVELYFIQEGQVRRRKPTICGIFNTGIGEIDKSWVLTDIRMIQRIFTHGFDSVNSFEVMLNSLDQLDTRANLINEELASGLTVQPVIETHFQIFQWLSLLDMNVIVIIVLMVLVSVVNMMTVLLVLIIDRTPMIGILKALGSRDRTIRQMFLFNGAVYLLKGMVWGNVIGLGLGWIQHYWGLIRLNEETYYLDKVPFQITWTEILWINGITLAICLLLLTIPALYVARIRPVRAIRFN